MRLGGEGWLSASISISRELGKDRGKMIKGKWLHGMMPNVVNVGGPEVQSVV